MHETFDYMTGYVVGIHRWAWVARLHAKLSRTLDSAAFGEGHLSGWEI